MKFFDGLAAAVQRNDSHLCVGLDPDAALMPPGVDVGTFCRAIIDATADIACVYKPNLAFFEALGPQGMVALKAVVNHIHSRGLLAIADAKRGDIGNSARLYARALFDVYGFDAATVNPYLGSDALEPFLERQDKGVFVLCLTSNRGAADLQNLPVAGEGRPLYEIVADLAGRWDRHGNVGLVVGATYPQQAARLRQICPDRWFLLPGVGAQGADLAEAVAAAMDVRGSGFIVNASRQVIYASRGDNYAEAARAAAADLRQQINTRRREVLSHLG